MVNRLIESIIERKQETITGIKNLNKFKTKIIEYDVISESSPDTLGQQNNMLGGRTTSIYKDKTLENLDGMLSNLTQPIRKMVTN